MKLLLFAFSISLFAQAPAGRVSGRVSDAQGLAVPEATVRLLSQNATVSSRSETDSSGDYSFERVAPGDYVLEVEKDLFRSATRELHLTGPAQQNIVLEVAGVSQTVAVTAAGGTQVEEEISKSISVIDQQEILNRNAVSVSDIIRYSPGVQLLDTGGIGQLVSMRIRGLRPDAAAVLIDGMRFRDTTTLQGDSSSFLSSLNFVSAERVEVLRGSASSLYGTNAVGGAVNIVTPQGGGDPHGEMQVEGGNLGLFRGRGSMSGGLFGDRLKYSLGVLHLNVTSGIDGQDQARFTAGQTFARYDFTPRLTLSGRFLGDDDFAMLNVSPTAPSAPGASIPATGVISGIPNVTFIPGQNDPDSRRASRFASAAFVLRDAITPLVSWQASYQKTHTSRTYDNGPLGSGFQPTAGDDFSRYIGGIDTVDAHVTGLPTRWLTLTGGYEFERESYRDEQNNNLPTPNQVLEHTFVAQNSNAVYFASQAGFFGRRLQISLSGREQSFELSRPEFQLIGTANNYNAGPLPSPPRAWTGDASVAFMATSSTKLRAHVGNAYRAPSLYERFGAGFYADPSTATVVFSAYGDPRLAPDRYVSVDAGFDQYLFANRVKISPTFFYTRIQQITAFDFSGLVNPATDPYGRFGGYINGSGGISRGMELAVETRPLRTLTVNGSYTYTNANTDLDLTVPGFFKAFSVHPHTVTLVATKQWGKRLDTTVDLFYGSSYYTAFFVGFGDRAYNFPGYTKTGLMANYRLWQDEKHSLRLYAKIDNLFNQTYYESGWLAAKATVAGGLGFRF